MIVIKRPKPIQGYKLRKLQQECQGLFASRFRDCNEVGAELALYLDDGQAGATFVSSGADADQFTLLLTTHNPVTKTRDEIRQEQREEAKANHANNSTFHGKTPAEMAVLIDLAFPTSTLEQREFMKAQARAVIDIIRYVSLEG